MARQPNIILINCDDLGWGDPGCCGHPRNHTPHLDRMAAEGTRFTDFYVASPLCSPSRGAMMTGCYPRRIGFDQFEGQGVLFPGQPIGLDPSEDTIAKALKRAGYATRIVGKWHCGDQPEFLPTRHGFDGYYGIPYSNDMGRQAGPKQPWPPLPLLRDESVAEEQPDQATITSRYVEDCVHFIRENRDGPFFLYFAHMYVHLPLYVQDRFLAESDNGAYGAAVAAIDWSVGVIMAELKRLGIDDDTLVLFTSDNGSRNDFGDSNGALRGTKNTTWDGGQRVPLIARWPETVPAGRTTGALLSSIDLLPSLIAIAGAEWEPRGAVDGLDASELLLGGSQESPRTHFAYYHFDRLEAVRSGRWKLHFAKSTWDENWPVSELYDLEHDVSESNNLYSDRPEVVEELTAVADMYRAELGDALTGAGGNCRPIGQVATGRTLTAYDPNHPYYMAEYDLSDRG